MCDKYDLKDRVVRAKSAASGRWHEILLSCGIPSEHLDGRARSCPVCGGSDRFTYDDKFGSGDYFCRGCGGGDGLSLIVKFCHCSFTDALKIVERFCGIDSKFEYNKILNKAQAESHQERIREMTRLWAQAQPITMDNPAGRYLISRGLDLDLIGSELRSHAGLTYNTHEKHSEPLILPAMIARVTDSSGCLINIHRTYLTKEGRKADVSTPKKLMPGPVKGGAVRFAQPQSILGLAEGVETAIAASSMFSVPVWATLGVTNMENFTAIPKQVRKVIIFSDNDEKFAGQAGAYSLAHKLACSGLEVSVRIAPRVGEDWLDEYVRLRQKR